MAQKLVLVVGLLVSLLQVQLSLCHSGHEHVELMDKNESGEWKGSHSLALKAFTGVDFRWLSNHNETVTMEMSSFTKGYVSVGFCPKWKGTMEGCDIVIGWVDNANGTAHLYEFFNLILMQDYYAKGNTLPELDTSQDYELLEGTQERGVTKLKFRRKWNTEDDSDADLENVRIIWAHHPEDCFSPDSFFKHAGNGRGHMMDDVSLKNPSLNHHHPEQLHGAGFSVQATNLVMTSCLICLFMFFHV